MQHQPLKLTEIVGNNPKPLWGVSAEQIAKAFSSEGYNTKVNASSKGSKLSLQVRVSGHFQISNIQVHPGGGRHVGKYYKVSTTTHGTVKLVDPATYKEDPKENAKIVNKPEG